MSTSANEPISVNKINSTANNSIKQNNNNNTIVSTMDNNNITAGSQSSTKNINNNNSSNANATVNNDKNASNNGSKTKITSASIQQIPPFRGKGCWGPQFFLLKKKIRNRKYFDCLKSLSLPTQSNSTSKSGSSNEKVTTVIATPGFGNNTPVKIQYCNNRVVGNGSFGVVYKADLLGF